MNTIDSLLSSFQHFLSHPLRTILTTLGMSIGVASLLSMVGISEGVRQRVIGDMERLGGAGLIILQSKEHHNNDKTVVDFEKTLLTRADLNAIKHASNVIEMTAPIISLNDEFYFESNRFSGQYFGTTPEYSKIRDWPIEKGRSILLSDIEHSKKICVLGSKVGDVLFKKIDPIGKRMRIGREEFTIVGVMSKRDSEAVRWMNQLVLIPITTMEKRLLQLNYLSKILVKAKSISMVPVLKQQIKRVIEGRHEDSQWFNIFSQEEVIRSVNKSTLLLRLSIGVSAIIVLLVGGIGIMNLMLVSVTERTREIGLRKALGATDMDILRQFLQEAVIISTIGGMLGIIFGLIMGELASNFIAAYLHDDIQSIVSIKAIGLAAIFVFLVGIFFGLYPAIQAARLDPSKALSYE